MTFWQALDRLYCAAPCQMLPNAVWKTRQALEGGDFTCTVEMEDGEVRRLTAQNASVLSVFWTRDRGDRVPEAMLRDVALAVLHDDYVTAEVRARFDLTERFFRLVHADAPVTGPTLPPEFEFAPVVLPAASASVAELIGRCYVDLKPSAEAVEGWTRHPVFAPDLWVWVVDRSTSAPVALGIAELDARVGEGSLEWIQVLPKYRGQGLGSGLVRELLRRLGGRSGFVTVSGQVDNATDPEMLYRRCGFSGQDIWWVLRRA